MSHNSSKKLLFDIYNQNNIKIMFLVFQSSLRVLPQKDVRRGHNDDMMIHKICQLEIRQQFFIECL